MSSQRIKLHTNLIWPGCTQGKYIVKAKGCILAVLRWGDCNGPLCDWSPFAYVPIDPAGNGVFFFSGMRGISPGVSHVWARCYAQDFASYEDISAEIPDKYLVADAHSKDAHRFSVLTDLHMAAKPWKIRQALRAAQSDTIFLLGDSTNDGLPEQFNDFRACIEEIMPGSVLFPVTGNHDVLHSSRPDAADGCKNYAAFQHDLLAKAAERGYAVTPAPDGYAYSVRIGNLDVIGLQCVTTGRRFLFPGGEQIDWLEEHLSETPASWHVILCHAPLLKHNPHRNDGVPYLDRNKRLQEILDRHERIIFLNGHTHVSPNILRGNAEYDMAHRNVYIDCGSVVPTDISGENGLMSPDWKDGCITELSVTDHSVEICMHSIDSGIMFSRGYYRFVLP